MSDNQTKLGVAPNVGGLLCNIPCCIGLIFSIVAVVVEKDNKFVRFHALQSLLLNGAFLVCGVALWVLSIIVGMILGPLALLIGLLQIALLVAAMGVMVFMMIKANNNEEFKLPVIGDMASQWV